MIRSDRVHAWPMVAPPFALALLAASLGATAAPQDDPGRPDPPAATAPAEPDSLPDLAPIMAAVAKIRGLEFKRPVPAERQPLEDWGAFVEKELERYFPPERQAGMQAGLLRLGMIREPMDLGAELKDALLSQAAAYYDPGTGKFFYLMTDLPADYLDVVAAHELVHALQDQHFDLGAMMERFEKSFASGVRDDDRMLAFRFLVEGEATYVMTVWQLQSQFGMDVRARPEMEKAQFRAAASMSVDQLVGLQRQMVPMPGEEGGALARAMAEMDSIPRYVLDPLLAAYMKGAYFAMSLRHHGGWEAIGAAFRELPRSTEQALHPEKFTDAIDEPTPIELPPLEKLAGRDGAAGWEPIDAAVHGEHYLGLLLRNFDCPEARAGRAVEGWDGDVYGAWRGPDGRVMVILASTWDTEDDAREFHQAYRSILPAKYADLAPDDGDDAGPDRHGFACGEAKLGRGLLVRRGREVFLVEGGGRTRVERIVASLEALPIARKD